jgi:hypothetical protein
MLVDAAAGCRSYNDVDSATTTTCKRRMAGVAPVVEEATGRASET